jgi:hypothetical protein
MLVAAGCLDRAMLAVLQYRQMDALEVGVLVGLGQP